MNGIAAPRRLLNKTQRQQWVVIGVAFFAEQGVQKLGIKPVEDGRHQHDLLQRQWQRRQAHLQDNGGPFGIGGGAGQAL